jgi:hypothetical protein
MMLHRCTFEGCRKTVEYPQNFALPPKGWSYLVDWGPGIQDGLYCKEHADALEAVLMQGGLDDPENDLDEFDESE